MSIDNLTEDDRRFIAAMEAAVEERGADWVYPKPQLDPDRNPDADDSYLPDEWHSDNWGTCVYQRENGEPACIVGLALHKMGEELPPFSIAASASSILDDYSFILSGEVVQAADRAQTKQDQGYTWGEALKTFKEVLAR